MIRIAEDSDIGFIYEELLLPFHRENGLAPLNAEKTLHWIIRMVSEGRVLVALRDGEIAGAIGLRQVPLPYSDKSLLCDEFFYVRMQWRGESVGRDLRVAFQGLANAGGQIGILTVLNPGRQVKRRRVSDLVGFLPFGYVLRIA